VVCASVWQLSSTGAVIKLDSAKTLLPYGFYALPYCPPKVRKWSFPSCVPF
jgi:hypothetical protein